MNNRHKRHSSSLCVTSAGQYYRHVRHTPLGGVTVVTLARVVADLVPMSRFLSGVAIPPCMVHHGWAHQKTSRHC